MSRCGLLWRRHWFWRRSGPQRRTCRKRFGPGRNIHRRLRCGEREAAYRLDEAAYGHSATRRQGWYDSERDRRTLDLPGFQIARAPVTNAQYARFIAETGHRPPDVDAETWKGYGLVHPYARTRRHAWAGGRPPEGRAQHPVVLVSHRDALAYTAWLSARTGRVWRLPTELEWEKAARGTDGRRFPWGDGFAPERLNSHDGGPFDTLPVGQFPAGASPFGLLTPPARCSNGPRPRPGRGVSWSRADPGTTAAAASAARPPATAARPG